MPYNLPTSRQEVANRMMADVKAQLPSSNPFLRNSYLGSLIWGFALRIFDIYQKLALVIREAFLVTAQFEQSILNAGDEYGLQRLPATAARGLITVTGVAGTVISGATIPTPSTTLQSLTGIQYQVTQNATISTQTVNVASMSRVGTLVTVNFANNHNLASGVIIDSISGATPSNFNGTNIQIVVTSPKQFQFTQAGTAGAASGSIVAQWTTASVSVKALIQGKNTNAAAGASLTLTNPIVNVDSVAYVQFDGISGGSNQESLTSYKNRILFRIQKPFSFFNNNDLITIVTAVPGVTRCWVFNPDTTSANINISGITRNGQIATATSVNHGLVDGDFITVEGAIQNEYNVIEKSIIVIDADTFAYVVAGTPLSPATGTITASYSYVMLGQVRIYFVRDNDANIIPSAQDVATVKDAVLVYKPAFMSSNDIIVEAPIANAVNFSFSALSPNTTAMQSAITSSLYDYFRTSNNVGQADKLADLNGVISQVIDSTGASPIYTLSAPSANHINGLGKIGTLGTITFP
jgi:uncharacterized phage protein gp47/JayE